MESRIEATIVTSTAPPTAPSGASLRVPMSSAMPTTCSMVSTTTPTARPNRGRKSAQSSAVPPGLVYAAQP